MPRLDQLADDGGADKTGRAGHENFHRKFLFSVSRSDELLQRQQLVTIDSVAWMGMLSKHQYLSLVTYATKRETCRTKNR